MRRRVGLKGVSKMKLCQQKKCNTGTHPSWVNSTYTPNTKDFFPKTKAPMTKKTPCSTLLLMWRNCFKWCGSNPFQSKLPPPLPLSLPLVPFPSPLPIHMSSMLWFSLIYLPLLSLNNSGFGDKKLIPGPHSLAYCIFFCWQCQFWNTLVLVQLLPLIVPHSKVSSGPKLERVQNKLAMVPPPPSPAQSQT